MIHSSPVHAWYLAHDLPVTPVNPASPTVNVGGKDYPAIKSLAELSNPKDTAVSIITAPPITLDVLKLAKEIGIPSVWLQPGTFDDEVIKFAQAEPAFSALVYGPGGRGSSGWCVLVDGEKALKDNGKL